MMGSTSEKEISVLNEYMPNLIQRHHESKSVIHLIYSKREKEKTYEEEIVDLLNMIEKYNIQCVQKVEDFTNHNEVGHYFLKYVQLFFKNNKNR